MLQRIVLLACAMIFFCQPAAAVSELEKFIYLENRLLKSYEKPVHHHQHEQPSIAKYGISIATSYVLSKILEYALWRRIESSWIKHGIYYLVPGATDYQDACEKINSVFFGVLIPFFLFMFSVVFDADAQGDAATLELFVKRWPVHKMHTPERFQTMFTALYQYYLEHKKLVISETLAHSILADVAHIIADFVTVTNKNNEREIEQFKAMLEKVTLPADVAEVIKKELSQLSTVHSDAAEATVIKKYIEWIIALPWGKYTQDTNDLAWARDILNQSHYGLAGVKERILDYLAVKAMNPQCKAPILCLAGPPGIGKTSIGKAIAQSLGKTFFRVSLGGLQDEAEIRGHRRTYVGAMPGRLIQAVRSAAICNPLILLDEIDKVGVGAKGDPSAALLEVLDPTHNAKFYDNYVGMSFDLSAVLFIATANDISRISKPLKDRMEIIMLPGYSFDEKREIARRHIIPKALVNAGLADKGFVLDDAALAYIITQHSKEPGVREVEQCINKLCARFARHRLEQGVPLVFDAETIAAVLG